MTDHIDQAVYETVHDSDVRTKEIATRLGMSHQVLINKANPQSEFHKLTLRESIALQLITGSRRIHTAMGVELDIDANPAVSPDSLLKSILSASKEHGDVVRAVHSALEDGHLTLREREQCHREIDEEIEALQNLRAAIVRHGQD